MKNKNIFDALICSIDGLKILFGEKSARRELLLLIFTIFYICILKPEIIFTLLLTLISILILSLEALNTGIEYTCNEITKKRSEKIRKAKDLGSASIFILLVAYLIIFIFSLLNNI